MTSEIATYEHPVFGSIRMFEEDGEIITVASDLAHALGYRDARDMIRSLEPDEFCTHTVRTKKGDREVYCVTEAGMYHAILMRKAACVDDPAFRETVTGLQQWVTHEVLPSIRKTGRYENPRFAPTREERLAIALRDADEVMAGYERRIAALSAENEEMRPKAALADAMMGSDDTILVRELAQLLTQAGFSIGGGDLFDLLRDDGYLIKAKTHDHNMPTRRSVELGLFEVREFVIDCGGEKRIKRTPRVTPKGQLYFLERYAGARALPELEVVA